MQIIVFDRFKLNATLTLEWYCIIFKAYYFHEILLGYAPQTFRDSKHTHTGRYFVNWYKLWETSV